MIDEYAALQGRILANIWNRLRPGGFLLYVTCSVFAAENEGQVQGFLSGHRADLLGMEMIKGYPDKADTLFTALLQKTL